VALFRDDCIRATGSLIFAALDAGHHVEWMDLAHRQRLVLSPFDDGQEILDRLARIELDPGPITPEALQSAVDGVSRKSAINLVLMAANAAVWETVESLRVLGRRVVVYLPETSRTPALHHDAPLFTYREHELRSHA
jgi:hypothetical protein